MSNKDKRHWLTILPKLNTEQKSRLEHSLNVKIDIAAAKASIDRALKIIDKAESEAEGDVKQDDVKHRAKQELLKEIEAKNPMMPKVEDVSAEKLVNYRQDAESKLASLRQELSQISQDAHGSRPPSAQAN